jgi:hypothetical protein
MKSTLAYGNFRFCLLFAMLAWLPQPSSALTLRDETYTCPLDGTTSTYQAVNSFSQFGMQLDLRPLGALVAPIPMPVCRDGGFVIYRDDFDDEEIALSRRLVRTPEYRVLRESETDYFVAAYQAGKLGEDAWTIAILTLQATWEVQGNPKKYDHYAALAVTRLEEAGKDYSPAGGTAEQWWTVKLLIVNLHRRLGELDTAGKLLAELPYSDEPADSGYRALGARLADLIARKDAAAAEIAPRENR